MKKGIIVLVFINCCIAAHAQGEIDLQPKVFWRNEWSVAVMLNSNGFGANYRYGKRINADNKHLFEVDFAYLKDPKESKNYVHIAYSNARYVEGKKNLAFDFRVSYGKQHEIYRKQDLGGVAIRHFYNFGPSVVLLKPIFYEAGKATKPDSNILDSIFTAKYNSKWGAQNVYVISRASFFKGFDNISIVPGAFAKFGFNFEFGKEDRIIHAIEAGVIAEGFIRKVEIMDYTNPHVSQKKVAQNQQFFLTLFVSYRFGRIVDPYEVKKKRERSKEISY